MKDIRTSITAVTVFTGSASVTRAGRIQLKKGREILSVTGLPRGLDPESIRVKGAGSGKTTISGIELRKTFSKEIPDGIVRELTDRINELESEQTRINDELDQLKKQRNHFDGVLKATRIFAAGFAKGAVNIEDHRKLTGFLSGEGSRVISESRKKEKEKEEVGKEIRKLKEELEQANQSRPRERYTAEITVQTEKECEFALEITYRIFRVSWTPVYDIRLEDKALFIDYYASIRQQTGEEWDHVSLRLSTFTPSLTSRVPELDPWFIAPVQMKAGGLDATRDSRIFAASEGIRMPDEKMSYSDVIREEFPEAEEADFQDAETSVSGAAVTYAVPDPASIPGDGSHHRVRITSMRFGRNFRYITAPAQDERVFRITETENGEHVLLPGRGQVYDHGEYIGPVNLDRVSPGESFDLFSGADDGVRISRELTAREDDKKLLSDRKKIHYSFEIRIDNLTREEKTIRVLDRIPAPAHEEIKVRLEESRPDPGSRDDLNRMEWDLKIGAGASSAVRYRYSVEFPREMRIPGLP